MVVNDKYIAKIIYEEIKDRISYKDYTQEDVEKVIKKINSTIKLLIDSKYLIDFGPFFFSPDVLNERLKRHNRLKQFFKQKNNKDILTRLMR